MAEFTFLSSRDPVDGDRMAHQLAHQLALENHTVTLFLVENGALLARSGVLDDLRRQLVEAGVEILADSFALAERGITSERLAEGVSEAGLDVVIDHLAAGRKVTWH